MPELLITSKQTPTENGSLVKVTPELAGWDYVGFEVFRLEARQALEQQTWCFCPGGATFPPTRMSGGTLGNARACSTMPPGPRLPTRTPYRVEAVTDSAVRKPS